MSMGEDTNVLPTIEAMVVSLLQRLWLYSLLDLKSPSLSCFGIHDMGYDLFTNLIFECSCSLCVTVIQFLFLLHSGSHILAFIALVVEFSAFSTNLLHEERCLLVFAGLIWCRVDGKEQDSFLLLLLNKIERNR